MNGRSQRPPSQPNVTRLQRLNLCCNEFEEAWKSGQPPSIESTLANAAANDQSDLLRLLIPLDIEYRGKEGEPPQPAEYCRRFPAVSESWIAEAIRDDASRRSLLGRHIESSDLPVGARIDQYEIVDKVGVGGMADVYRARHVLLQKDVALKLLKPYSLNADAEVARFHKEVVVLAGLSHPNIVAAIDAGGFEDRMYLVTEYIEGTDLSQLIHTQGPLPIETGLEYIRQAALGLRYVHEAGIVHRDVKPSNLLLDRRDCIKVGDLGLARLKGLTTDRSAEFVGQTRTDMFLGTVDYMSPEQARLAKDADERSDVYSLGCTLYYLLTGRVPYPGDAMIDRLDAHRHHPPPLIGDSVPDAPHALDTIYLQMVAKQPEDRFPGMKEVLDALSELQNMATATTVVSEAVHAKEVGQSRPISRRTWAVSAAAAAGALSLLSVGLVCSNRSPSDDEEDPDAARKEAPSFDATTVPFKNARAMQDAWADYLGVSREFTDDMGIDFVLIPPRPIPDWEYGCPDREAAGVRDEAQRLGTQLRTSDEDDDDFPGVLPVQNGDHAGCLQAVRRRNTQIGTRLSHRG